MKETKVYVDEMPKSCAECEHCTKHHKDNYGIPYCLIARMPLYNGDKINEERGQHKDSLSDFDCPLIDIKTHDRELVKKVCEKIRKTIASTVDLAESNQQIKDQFHIILDLVEKEYEK